MLGPETVQLLALQLGDRLALGEGLRHRLAVHLAELRLVIKRLEVRRASGHIEMNHPLGPALEVQRRHDALPVFNLDLSGSGSFLVVRREGSRVQECAEGHGPHSSAASSEKGPAGLLQSELVTQMVFDR